MPGRWFDQLFEVAAGQYGFVTTADVQALGGGVQLLANMHRRGQLERISHGVYRFRSFPSGPFDELMAATLWPRGLGVICHDSALDLWDLCDVNPARIHVTIPKTARIRRTPPPAVVVHERDLDPGEITHHEGITVVTPLRAILDGIDSHLDTRLIDQAITTARDRGLVLTDELPTIEAAR